MHVSIETSFVHREWQLVVSSPSPYCKAVRTLSPPSASGEPSLLTLLVCASRWTKCGGFAHTNNAQYSLSFRTLMLWQQRAGGKKKHKTISCRWVTDGSSEGGCSRAGWISSCCGGETWVRTTVPLCGWDAAQNSHTGREATTERWAVVTEAGQTLPVWSSEDQWWKDKMRWSGFREGDKNMNIW